VKKSGYSTRLLWLILGIGLLLRLISAYNVFGPQALDDYKHGVWPAYQWAIGQAVDLPEYRSYILVWMLGEFVRWAGWFGITSAVAQVRSMYIGLALVSLIGFIGPYFYFKQNRVASIAVFLLLAFFPLMPFVSTRAFGEAVALPFVLTGLCLSEVGREKSSRWIFSLGLAALGIAVFFRFQVGLIYVTYGLILLLEKNWRRVLDVVCIGLVLIGLQVLLDQLSGREAFSTLRAYLHVNEGGAAQYGASPWYMTWLQVLGLTLFPLSLVFLSDLKSIWRRYWRILVPALVFVLLHSLTKHKEERFMYPIVGVVLLFLTEAISRGWSRPLVRRLYLAPLGVISVIGLSVACFSNTQVGEIGPAAILNEKHPSSVLIDRDSLLRISRIKDFFIRPPSQVLSVEEPVTPSFISEQLLANPAWTAAAVLTSDIDHLSEIENLSGKAIGLGLTCGETQMASSWVDRLLFRMNPNHNQRRRPTWFVICEKEETEIADRQF
jgi:hypothetical protein